MNHIHILPCIDSEELATSNQRALDISRLFARDLGRLAVEASNEGAYVNAAGRRVQWGDTVQTACAAKLSVAPTDPLPVREHPAFAETRIQVTNETTFGASRRLVDRGMRPLALNFANGFTPGGGFLNGARAQEETLCRSSALYLTLMYDRMYKEHAERPFRDSTDWCILSPDVPVFREDDGTPLEEPWLLSFITCAAPEAKRSGTQMAADLLRQRIHRVLAVAHAHGFEALVLGAWGCGAFGNDPHRTAADFRNALETEFRGAFSEIVFAISDWSPERRFLGPFRDVFMNGKPADKAPEDPFNLQRFVEAQADCHADALGELRRGRKISHWMWYVFPQIDGLGTSGKARFYAIKSAEEARCYLRHPILGPRLVEYCEALLSVEGKTAREILGFPDDLKLRSCATLFLAVSPQDPVFNRLIARFFDSLPDQRTLDILAAIASPEHPQPERQPKSDDMPSGIARH